MALLLVACGCGGSSSTHADVEILKGQSFCRTFPLEAKLGVYVTLHNAGGQAETITAIPVRRYSDGSTNESPMDEFTMKTPASTTKRFYSLMDYDPTRHELLDCAVRVDDKVTKLRVANPG